MFISCIVSKLTWTTSFIVFLSFCCHVACCYSAWFIMFFVSSRSAPQQNVVSAMEISSHSKKKRTKSSSSNDGSDSKTLTNFTSLLKMGLPQCPPLPSSPVDIGHTALSKVQLTNSACILARYSASVDSGFLCSVQLDLSQLNAELDVRCGASLLYSMN